MHADHRTSGQTGNSVPRVIEIELLALDLDRCDRCAGTLRNIEQAIGMVRPILEATGTRVSVQKTIIESEEQARRHRFATSPTVRVNGQDITFETLESKCDSCTDLCGCDQDTNCRVWRYRGKEYTEAPVGLIVEALLRAIGGDKTEGGTPAYEGVPENLRRFFAAKAAKQPVGTESCCPSTDREACCAPGGKAVCCGTPETATGGRPE